jgi:hypothetical protein
MNDFTILMADFAVREAERQSRVGEEIEQLKSVLVQCLQAAGIARVEVRFDGGGDSGAVEELLCFDAAEDAVACPDTAIALSRKDQPDGVRIYAPPTLQAALEQLTYLALERHHPGWENNDGAAGQLVIDVAEARFALECSLRFVATDDHSTQL